MAGSLVASFARAFRAGARIEAQFEIPIDSSVTVLFGASGAGKTTILRALAGLERPDSGRITYGEERWFSSEEGVDRAPQARRLGFLHQDHALFPHLTVHENVAFGAVGATRQERRETARSVLRDLGIEPLASRRPRTLSGGERARVALARALARAPKLLLLDEPLASLDAPTRESLQSFLRSKLEAAGVPSIIVTHDRGEAMRLGDRIIVVAGGRVRQTGEIEEVFSRPADPEVASIVGVETVVHGRVEARRDGLAEVRVGSARIVAIDPGEGVSEVLVSIRAEDVSLARGAAGRESPRNRIPARVTGLRTEGALVRVELDAGFRLAAYITRASREELGIEPGVSVEAVVKAPSVHLIPRD